MTISESQVQNSSSAVLTHEKMISHVIHLFRDTMPFNRFLQLFFEEQNDSIALRVNWREELTGNPMQRILHGGVTASMLDTIGGLVAIIETIKQTPVNELPSLREQLATTGTIDMRVDYLRPGRGTTFVATAEVIRRGSRVVVCRMELHNEKGDHIAFGTGTYMLG